MKVTLQALLLAILCLVSSVPLTAQVGTWRNYLAYSEPQQIAAASGNDIFVLASNSLYQYNTADGQITTYDKVNGMNGVGITNIAWNKTAKRLIATYSDSNIDIVDTDGNVVNISGLYDKSTTDDKTINTIYINDRYAYLCTNFGIVKVDMVRAEVSETYNLQMQINATVINGSNILARTTSGIVLTAQTNTNLQDPANWQQTSNFTASMFDRDLTDWNKYIDVVRTLKPGGPKYNYFGNMRFKNNRLYTCGGGYGVTYELLRPGCVQILQDNKWDIYEDVAQSDNMPNYIDILGIDCSRNNHAHVFASGRTGVYEFENGKFVKLHTYDNSTLLSVFGNNKEYVVVQGLIFDDKDNLWCLNSMVNSNIHYMSSDNKWYDTNISLTNGSNNNLCNPVFDSRGLLWFANNNYVTPALHCYQPENNGIKSFTSFVNQDGTSVNVMQGVTCVVEDENNDIWIGTSSGPLLLQNSEITSDSPIFTQVKIPRNDGTNYADYLLSGVEITSIVIDGGGRKWFGTNGNGVYLISADNMTQLEHFTKSNSCLISDYIESMAINQSSGEIFFGTNNGLCSYISDATMPNENMTTDNVYAYPNPVTPDYNGLVTITGLSYYADVKIVTSNGILVAQGRSNGGTFTWNCNDLRGRRVASGIYMVETATENGNKGIVCKIAVLN